MANKIIYKKKNKREKISCAKHKNTADCNFLNEQRFKIKKSKKFYE
jgi:hypothetical protein